MIPKNVARGVAHFFEGFEKYVVVSFSFSNAQNVVQILKCRLCQPLFNGHSMIAFVSGKHSRTSDLENQHKSKTRAT